MRTVLAVALTLTASLAAFADGDPFEGLNRGDKIVLTTTDGGTFKGIVKSIVGDNLRLEIRTEGSDTVGSLLFERANVRRIVVIGSVPVEDLDKPPKTDEGTPENGEKPPKTDGTDKPEELTPEEKAAALLAKFPPPDWSEARKKEIEEKAEWERGADEREFLTVYADWTLAMEGRKKEERLELLKKFPPKDGWGQERYTKLKNQFIVMGIPLKDDEKEFVEKFEDWKKGLEEFNELGKEPEKPTEEEAPKEPEAPAGPATEEGGGEPK